MKINNMKEQKKAFEKKIEQEKKEYDNLRKVIRHLKHLGLHSSLIPFSVMDKTFSDCYDKRICFEVESKEQLKNILEKIPASYKLKLINGKEFIPVRKNKKVDVYQGYYFMTKEYEHRTQKTISYFYKKGKSIWEISIDISNAYKWSNGISFNFGASIYNPHELSEKIKQGFHWFNLCFCGWWTYIFSNAEDFDVFDILGLKETKELKEDFRSSLLCGRRFADKYLQFATKDKNISLSYNMDEIYMSYKNIRLYIPVDVILKGKEKAKKFIEKLIIKYHSNLYKGRKDKRELMKKEMRFMSNKSFLKLIDKLPC